MYTVYTCDPQASRFTAVGALRSGLRRAQSARASARGEEELSCSWCRQSKCTCTENIVYRYRAVLPSAIDWNMAGPRPELRTSNGQHTDTPPRPGSFEAGDCTGRSRTLQCSALQHTHTPDVCRVPSRRGRRGGVFKTTISETTGGQARGRRLALRRRRGHMVHP